MAQRIVLGDGREIPAAELRWEFARSSGPGGQSVNTSSTQVRLLWNIADSAILSEGERSQIARRLPNRLHGGELAVVSSVQRSQWQNRIAASHRLVELVDRALSPGPSRRKPTRPTGGSKRRRRAAKSRRSELKATRRRPDRHSTQ